MGRPHRSAPRVPENRELAVNKKRLGVSCGAWMTAPITDALQLERPLADGLLSVFARGEKRGSPASSGIYR